jgi:hypothetical protein
MSGPGLNQRDAHHAIHRAAFHEAEQLTLLLRQALRTGDQQRALQVAAVLIEHWQTRTLRHAEAEETGWYCEILDERPELQADVIALTRDHELLRLLLAEIQGILLAQGIASGIVERFEAMLLLNGIHSREEEHRLLGREPVVEQLDGDQAGAHGATQPGAPSRMTREGASDLLPDAHVAPVPLAVARPALHARLIELLRQRGLSPADLLAELRPDSAREAVLHVAYGREYAQAMEWPLEADVSAEASEATEATENMLRQIVEACERATQADYHARMRTPT